MEGEIGNDSHIERIPDSRKAVAPRSVSESVAQLLFGLTAAVDRERPEQIANFFTPEGIFQSGATELRGRTAISDYYAQRFSSGRQITRHIWANVSVVPLDSATAQVTAALTNYAYNPQEPDKILQLRVGDVEAICVLADSVEWRLSKQIYRRVFTATIPLSEMPKLA